jgi:hemoglobin
LYRRLGGHETIAAVVDVFSRNVAVDPRLASCTSGVEPNLLRRRQIVILCALLGGPCSEPGSLSDLAATGAPPGAEQIELILGHLAAALTVCDVPAVLGAELLQLVAKTYYTAMNTEP